MIRRGSKARKKERICCCCEKEERGLSSSWEPKKKIQTEEDLGAGTMFGKEITSRLILFLEYLGINKRACKKEYVSMGLEKSMCRGYPLFAILNSK